MLHMQKRGWQKIIIEVMDLEFVLKINKMTMFGGFLGGYLDFTLKKMLISLKCFWKEVKLMNLNVNGHKVYNLIHI